MRVAVLDLGTNTFHLLIAELEAGGGFRQLYARSLPVKIGEGGIHRRVIARAAFRRGLEAVQEHYRDIRRFHCEDVRVIGTSALRNARNGARFCSRIRKMTGLEVDVISGEREAELIYKGVRAALDPGPSSLILDIGGGSVECILSDAREPVWKGSFEIGAARLLEKFHRHDPIDPEAVGRMQVYLERKLQPLWQACDRFSPLLLIGSAGSFETFAEMIARRPGPASGSPDEKPEEKTSVRIEREDFLEIYRDLVQASLPERLAMPGMLEMRADMIVVAAILTGYVLKRTGISDIVLSVYALKEGVLAELAGGLPG